MTAAVTDVLRIGSAEAPISNWTPTWTGGDDIYAINQDLGGSPADTRYAAFDCAAANDGQTIEWQLHPLTLFGLELIKSFQIRVRYQFQNFTDDTVTVTATIRDGIGDQVGNSWSATAVSGAVIETENTLFSYTGGSEPSRADVEDYSIRFEVSVSEASTPDGIVFRLIGFEVDFNLDQDDSQRWPELLYVSEVSQEVTGYSGYSNGIAVTLPAGVNRKMIGFFMFEGDMVTTVAGDFRYNSTSSNTSTWWGSLQPSPSTPDLTDEPGVSLSYWDIADGDSGSKTINYRATNNLSFTTVPVAFFFMIFGNMEAGNPVGEFGTDSIGNANGFLSTDDREITSSGTSEEFDDFPTHPRIVVAIAFSETEGASGRWMFDFTDDGHKLIAVNLSTGQGEFSADTVDFDFPDTSDPILIGLRFIQDRNQYEGDASRGVVGSPAPFGGYWFRQGVPVAAIDTVDSDDVIVRGQGSATVEGDLDGAQGIVMEGSGVGQPITAQTAEQVTFTFDQGDMKFGNNNVEVLVTTPGVPT
jgi:hypothetical protein